MEALTQEQLAASLWQWDVPYLNSMSAAQTTRRLEPEELITLLITSDASRLRLGVVAFYLRHPEFAKTVAAVLGSLDSYSRELFKHYYTASVYLQRYWLSALKPWSNQDLPDYFSKELKLPDPQLLHGRIGLVALEESLQKLTRKPASFVTSFNALANLMRHSAHA